ncbi:hypothetical protein BLA24_32695 [Streptomyces cinnamoneus]|uniref:Uncharacterized protein n=1 Tax=Streptomyces cinnamoneus TaxID=53446 RepID=A0A2G1XAD8_STRCJ|nr:hypothetical protein [Streptomyces cinnamoneus]PHQ48183.1 hypothetical protein BLA24_32695 [Streptomyces cinnamoneus]PPT15809.1 hypothetical protein CYQ11_25745 [Streptomyces cinnamoneus]
MSEREYPPDPEPEPEGRTCQWCHGSGFVSCAFAYSPGADPFKGPADTVHRAGQCKHCLGRGTYDSRLDPTLDRGGGPEGPEGADTA